MNRRSALLLLALLAAPLAGPAVAQDSAGWQRALDRAVPAVVALRVATARPFDTEHAAVGAATGFVVDAERGIILTNRHVVSPGPVTAEAVFLDHEKVEIEPIYRDPVHDFGFFRFDPAAVRFMPLRAIELAPERARVGTEIRVIGNDSGEKLSILDGTLARLDRQAPRYGPGRYNDFNTFYIQAASSTSGGSSGSPVIDRSGRAVALNAGAATRSSSSFFLPLDRVVRALEKLRAGEPVTRGTLLTSFRHAPFEELRRLGLPETTEARLRREDSGRTGMLVVDEALPGGPAAGALEPGDVMLALDGRRIDGFVELDARLDEHVGQPLEVEVQRGGAVVRVSIEVADLHATAPDRYVEFSGGVIHPISYQLARSFGVPAEGLVVAAPGHALARAGIPRFARLETLGGWPIAGLEPFFERLSRLPDGERVPVRWSPLGAPHEPRVSVVSVDRRWLPLQHCRRDDASGRWPCQDAPPPPPSAPAQGGSTRFQVEGPKPVQRAAASLVFVDFDLPVRIDGAHGATFSGSGLVVDAEAGLVVTDRDTVPAALGDARLTFARSLSVPAEVVALHPEHGLALLKYDPALLGDTPVRSAELRSRDFEAGEALWLVGLQADQRIVFRPTHFARRDAGSLPLPNPPRFRESNLERIVVSERAPTVGGVLVDGKGRVRALWASFSHQSGREAKAFFAGIDADILEELRDGVLREGRFRWRTLGAELGPLSLAEARERGLPEEWARRLEAHDPVRRQALEVRRVAADVPAAERLRPGDLLLAADSLPVVSFREVERAARSELLQLTLFRDGAVQVLDVPTRELDARGTDHVLAFAGALLQSPHHALAAQRGIPREGVYVAGRWRGSPAEQYQLQPGLRILAVDDTPTPDLASFLAATRGRPDGGSLRLRVEALDRQPAVRTLELDLDHWPAYELVRRPEGWERRRLDPPSDRLASDASR